MAIFGDIVHRAVPFKRETAHFNQIGLLPFVCKLSTGKLNSTKAETSNSKPSYCQHRYPSPRRSVHILNRPTHPIADQESALANCRRLACALLVILSKRNNSSVIGETNESSEECSGNLGLSQPRLPLVWQAVWTQTASALSQAQAQALSPQKCLAPTGQGPLSLAQLPACYATTLASVTNAIYPPAGARLQLNRRAGLACAAVFRSRDIAHV